MNKQLVIALDIGGSSVKSAVVASTSRIEVAVSEHSIDSTASAAEILETFATVITGHLENCTEVRGIAVAFPGPFNYEQGISLMQGQQKYDALYGLHVSASLKKILGLPALEIRYRNDAEAAILGEALYGAGAGFSRLLGLTLGTGLGSAFVTDSAILSRGPGVPDHGWLYSQSYGVQRADDVFSTRGLLARLGEHGIQAADVASVIGGANEHDDVLTEVFASFGTDLGKFLKPFVSNFGADGVLVTGGIAEAWDRFAQSLRRSLPVPVVKGTLGRRAPLLGAAALYF
jgi:glucokinase